MKAPYFLLALVVLAAAAWALLWAVGYWVIAFAVAVAVFVVGGVAYFAVRAGAAGGPRHRHA